MPTINIRLDDDTRRDLRIKAAELGMTQGEVVRLALYTLGRKLDEGNPVREIITVKKPETEGGLV